VPGIDAARFAAFFSTQNGTLLGMFNMFSGGALQRFSIFALNVMPYITASIIVQMASMVYPPWNQIRKDGESGRRKSQPKSHRSRNESHRQADLNRGSQKRHVPT